MTSRSVLPTPNLAPGSALSFAASAPPCGESLLSLGALCLSISARSSIGSLAPAPKDQDYAFARSSLTR